MGNENKNKDNPPVSPSAVQVFFYGSNPESSNNSEEEPSGNMIQSLSVFLQALHILIVVAFVIYSCVQTTDMGSIIFDGVGGLVSVIILALLANASKKDTFIAIIMGLIALFALVVEGFQIYSTFVPNTSSSI
jgi:hypothetical protein